MTAGIYAIQNKKNGKCYVGSSKNVERRWQQHIDDLVGSTPHHSYKLQEAYNEFGDDCFDFILLRSVVDDGHLELTLEILERAEVLERGCVNNGYNVSDEIIRDTSLVLEFCSRTIDIYFSENEKKFLDAQRRQVKSEGFFRRLMFRAWRNSNDDVVPLLDIERQAREYLRMSLTQVFEQSGVSKGTAERLSDTYVIDTMKLRDGSFRYYRKP